MREPIGVIGLGLMGGAFARHLAAADFTVSGFDPDTTAAARAEAAGVSIARDGAALAADARLVLTSLPSVEAADFVIAELCSGFREPGGIIAEMSTLPLAHKLRLADVAAAAGHILLDCPVSGTGAQAQTGDIVLYASGDADGIARLRPFASAFSRQLIELGEVGNGTRVKLVANLLVAIHNVAAAEAMLLGMRAGLDPQRLVEVIAAGAATSRVFELRAPMMAADRFLPATMKLDVWAKDLAAIAELACESGTATPLFDRTIPLYAAATEAAPGLDTAAVLRTIAALEPSSSKRSNS